jgi:hypothetical protein
MFIKLKTFEFNDNIFGFFVPIAISALLILLYFRKKLLLLNMSSKHREFTLFISWALLFAPIVTFIFYLERQTGELTQLKSVDEISTNKSTKYYSIESSSQHKDKSGFYIGKGYPDRGREIGIGCYYVCPLTNKGDSIKNNNIWIGTMFGKKFSNRVFDNKEKQAKLISEFIDSSSLLYNKHKFKTSFLTRLQNSDEQEDYLNAVRQANPNLSDGNIIILIEQSGDYQSRAGTSLWWTVFFIISSNLIWTLLTIFSKLKRSRKKNVL